MDLLIQAMPLWMERVARVPEKNVLDAGDHEIGYNLTLLAPQLGVYLTLFAKRMLSKLKISRVAGQSLKNWNDMHSTNFVVP